VNTRRLIGLIVLALFAGWVVLRSCTREEPVAPPAPMPVREAFHASKPLHPIVTAQRDQNGKSSDVSWIERELRYLLTRGQMRIAPQLAVAPPGFVLRVEIGIDAKQAKLQLIAPDEVIEREKAIALPEQSRLAAISALAQALPEFLEASHTSKDWRSFIGTSDERVYESYVRNASDLFGPTSQGVTRPSASRPRARTVERLESLTRNEPGFARAWGALAVGYLSLGGDDVSSLSDLAESSAERALALDEEIAEAHAALGHVDLRHNDWIAAQEKFESALSLDANLAAALEGLACLYADAGHYDEALKHASRAIALQPRNAGANECLTYAQLGTSDATQAATASLEVASVARVRALVAFFDGDRRSAERLLRGSMSQAEYDIWVEPLLRAAASRRSVPDALKAITRAANDGYIDAATEILCGAALKQPDFVFNRIARLQREDVHAPLRLLWLPQAVFLRSHARFEETINAAGLSAFWHDGGPPDVCTREPAVYGCNIKGERAAKPPLSDSTV
jgi:tetratricopeptide (TPR) repeat protein